MSEPTESPFMSAPGRDAADNDNDYRRDASVETTSSSAYDGGHVRQAQLQGRRAKSRSDSAGDSSPRSSRIASSHSQDESQPALSFMGGSWRAGLPKGGSAGLGHHSLMQMMKAISLDTSHDRDDSDHVEEPSSSTSVHGPDRSRRMSGSHLSPLLKCKTGSKRSSNSMSSSIDAIYSPISRQKAKGTVLPSLAEMTAEIEEDQAIEVISRDTHQPVQGEPLASQLDASTAGRSILAESRSKGSRIQRGDSTLSHRQVRRATLAEKLKEVFDLPEIEEILEEYPCWLFRSVMLQGYLYLTTGHLCFYAYLNRHEGQALRSGSLFKKSSKSPMYTKFWAVLREDALSWYASSTDPYFPLNQIDLHYVTSIEASKTNPRRFRVISASQRHHFEAESERSKHEWMKAIKKAVFTAQNHGESVKIAIPLETVSAIDKSKDLGFDETTLRLVITEEGTSQEHSTDEYYWSFGKESSQTVDDFREAILTARTARQEALAKLGTDKVSHVVVNTARGPPEADRTASLQRTGSRVSSGSASSYNPLTMAQNSAKRLASTSASLANRFNPFALDADASTGSHAAETKVAGSSTPEAASVATIKPRNPYPYPDSKADGTRSSPASPSQSIIMTGYGYPPTMIPSEERAHDSAWTLSHWVRPSKALSGVSAAVRFARLGRHHVRETVERPQQPGRQSLDDPNANDAFQVVTAAEVREDYAKNFAANEAEEVISRVHGYLFRGLPVYGYLYVTTAHFCFRSTSIVAKTKMVLPIIDMIAVQRARAYRLGYHGLVIVVRGHEEIFFELSSRERRDNILDLLENQLEETRAELKASQLHSRTRLEADALKELEASVKPAPLPMELVESSPIMFSSTTSSFVTFKPDAALRITCLTIGSRGDVQPYIALCLGLMKDGHKCRIASHPEYRDWVEGYGIEYASVGGDPAELMRICVENGMFTVSFLREGVAKFRGWLDELLTSSWTACQGCDLLIESPSTMAGCHIAEALQIPYFKAFTMPWTRTRAYPHAFAVPEVRMGGGYNYMTYTIFDQIFWRAIAGQINRWRKNVLGLQPTNQDKLESHKQPFLYNFSPSVVPPPLDWMEYIHVTGYWFLPNAKQANADWTPPDSLTSFIARARASKTPLVYIGFGSIVVSDPEGLTKTIVDAVQQAGVYAIISKGWSDRALAKDASAEAKKAKAVQDEKDLGTLPDKIYNIDSIPHDWLFPRVDAVCHHGGAGTTGASLRAGRPTIIRPFFGDQAFWAERVDAMKVGKSLRHMSAHSLASALEYVTRDETVRKRAAALGEQIKKEDGVATAIEALYRDFEYAKSLIKRNTRIGPQQSDDSIPPPLNNHADLDPDVSDNDSAQWDMLSDRLSADQLSESDENASGSSDEEAETDDVPRTTRSTESSEGDTPAASLRFERADGDA